MRRASVANQKISKTNTCKNQCVVFLLWESLPFISLKVISFCLFSLSWVFTFPFAFLYNEYWRRQWLLPGKSYGRRSLHDWATSLSLFSFMHWRKWQSTPVFLPGESQGRGSLMGCPSVAQSWTQLKWLSSSIMSMGFPVGWQGNESACKSGNLGLIWVRKIPWRRACNPLQYPCLENPQGQRSLVGYRPQGQKELDMTD